MAERKTLNNTWSQMVAEVDDQAARLARLEAQSRDSGESKTATTALELALATAEALRTLAEDTPKKPTLHKRAPGLDLPDDDGSLTFDEAMQLLRQAAEEGDERAKEILKSFERREADEKNEARRAQLPAAQARGEIDALKRIDQGGRPRAEDLRSRSVGTQHSVAVIAPTPDQARKEFERKFGEGRGT